MPQGGIDKGEDPQTAAMRELREETGITSAKIISETNEWHHYDFPREFATKAWGGKYRGQNRNGSHCVSRAPRTRSTSPRNTSIWIPNSAAGAGPQKPT